MNFVLWIKRFYFVRPFLPIETLIVVECDDLCINIDIDALDRRKFTTHIFDESRARSAVHAGNGNCSSHSKKTEEISEVDLQEYNRQ